MLKGIPIKSAQILIKNVEGGKFRNKEALWYDLSGRWNRHPIPCHRVLLWLQTRAELVSHAELWTLRQGDAVRLRKKNILILSHGVRLSFCHTQQAQSGSGEIDGGELLSCSSFVETQARRSCILQGGFLLVGPWKWMKVADYIINPIKKVLSVRSHF